MIRSLSRVAASLSVLLSLLPTEAAAQFAAARAASEVRPVAGVVAPAGAFSAFSAPSAAFAAAPSFSAAPSFAPALAPAGSAAALAAPSATLSAAPALAALPAASIPAAAPSAVLAAAPAETPAARTNSAAALRSVSETLRAASTPDSAVDRSANSLDSFYAGAAVRPSADDAVAAPALDSSRLSAASLREPSESGRAGSAATPAAPRTTFKRTFAVGYLTGFVGMALTILGSGVASMIGWHQHGNYHMPLPTHGGIAAAIAISLGASVLAPMAEEVLFRGGLQGGLSKLTTKLRLGAFAIPALITSAVFVVVHETSDPVLMGVRFIFAYMLSRTYAKEGILASMAAHGTFNGLLVVPLALGMIGAPMIFQIAFMPLALWAAVRAYRTLKAEKPEIEAGTLAPKPLGLRQAAIIVPALLAGFFFLMPNLFWLAGATALALWAAVRMVSRASR